MHRCSRAMHIGTCLFFKLSKRKVTRKQSRRPERLAQVVETREVFTVTSLYGRRFQKAVFSKFFRPRELKRKAVVFKHLWFDERF